jgi:hypothetical protein
LDTAGIAALSASILPSPRGESASVPPSMAFRSNRFAETTEQIAGSVRTIHPEKIGDASR